ncbi:hypothetical protein J6590_002469, partial [Homalodisca vitripennis]
IGTMAIEQSERSTRLQLVEWTGTAETETGTSQPLIRHAQIQGTYVLHTHTLGSGHAIHHCRGLFARCELCSL